MKTVWTDCRLPSEMKEKLHYFGCETIDVPPCGSLTEPIASHPDMNILTVCGKRFTRCETIVRNSRGDCLLLQGTDMLSYPDEAALNAVCIGNDFIYCEKSVYKPALHYASECGMRTISVRQGYVKCNVAVVNESQKAVITEDSGIAKVLRGAQYDVLKLNTYSVKLLPFQNGFIGGASGSIGDAMVFTGNIEMHPEYEAIRAFCRKHGKNAVSLSHEPLYDFGSLLPAD